MDSSSEAGSLTESLAGGEAPSLRATQQVGSLSRVASLTGCCIDDDIAWKGSAITRCTALQTRGSGGCMRGWGAWWGSVLNGLGTDIGVLSETQIHTDAKHALAISGLAAAGFSAVSHNRDWDSPAGRARLEQPTDTIGSGAGGVILAVRRSVVAAWDEVRRDADGRALAANLLLADGAVVRVIGVYGPTGACLPSFASSREGLAAEARLVLFVAQESTRAVQQGWHCVVAGT